VHTGLWALSAQACPCVLSCMQAGSRVVLTLVHIHVTCHCCLLTIPQSCTPLTSTPPSSPSFTFLPPIPTHHHLSRNLHRTRIGLDRATQMCVVWGGVHGGTVHLHHKGIRAVTTHYLGERH